jgi:hypothetical protein
LNQLNPALQCVQERPPYPNLPPVRYRLKFPDAAGILKEIEYGVRTFAPQRWVGIQRRN